RRWDIVQSTALRAGDTLSLFNIQIAQQFLAVPNLNELFVILGDIRLDTPWFNDWRSLFTKALGSPATDVELEHLKDEDSVMGWTSSNVLKRLRLKPMQQQRLRESVGAVGAVRDVVKWRVVHVLGSFPSEPNARLLLACLQDETVEVRF